jgi:hypothetical protein
VAGREIAEIYSKLRDQALGFGSAEIKAPPVVPGGRALGVIMDIGYETAVVSVMGLADGTTSMYISNGGGTLGIGDHEQAAASRPRRARSRRRAVSASTFSRPGGASRRRRRRTSSPRASIRFRRSTPRDRT